MPLDGSGGYALPSGQPVVTGTTISSTTHNTLADDQEDAFDTAFYRDGQAVATANTNWGGFRLTNIAAATATTDAARASQVQSNALKYLTSVAGTDTITATCTPTPTLVVGQIFEGIAANTNTGATTLNISSIGAGAIQRAGSALTGGELVQNAPFAVMVSNAGTPVFQLITTGLPVGRNVTETLTNKTLTSPAVNTPTITGAVTGSTVTIGAGSGTGTHVVVANINTSAVGNVGGGTDNLMSYTLPANSLSANGKSVRITAYFETVGNANAKTVGCTFGGTSILNVGLTTGAANGVRHSITVTRTGSNAQFFYGDLLEGSGLLGASKTSIGSNSIAVTDTGAIVIQYTGAATSDNDIVQRFMLVEFLN